MHRAESVAAPAPKPRSKKRASFLAACQTIWILHWDFILLSLVLLFVNCPYLAGSIWPQHDTLFSSLTFHSFYNDFFLNGEIARWMPYGTYGIQADHWQLFDLSPASYFMGAVGFLFRVKNILLLFKFAVILEQFMLLFGTYLLARELFRYKSTVFFVCLGMIASTVWIVQIIWNFRVYYLLPLVLYLLIQFFKSEKPRFFWMAGMTSILALMGNLPYLAPLYLLIGLIFCSVSSINHKRVWLTLFTPSKENLIFFTAFLFLAAVYLYFALSAFFDTKSFAFGRDSVTQMAVIENFMRFSGSPGRLLGFIFGGLSTLEFTFYCGLLVLVFFLYALLNVRNHVFTALGCVAVFLFSFSLADISFLARSLYYFFPPIRFYRYIGHVGGMLRLFLLIGAGFGMDQYLNDREEAESSSVRGFFRSEKGFLACGIFVLAAAVFLKLRNAAGTAYPQEWTEFFYYTLLLLGTAVLVLGGRPALSSKNVGIIAVVCLAFDLFSYQNVVATSSAWPYQWNWPWAVREVSRVRPFHFQDERFHTAATSPVISEASKVIAASDIRQSVEAYNFILFDPCLADPPVLQSAGVYRLIYARDPFILNTAKQPVVMKLRDGEDVPPFLRAIGCVAPKLRLFSNILFAENSSQAEKMVKETLDISQKIILERVPVQQQAAWVSSPEDDYMGDVRVNSFTFNRLDLEATVTRAGGAWLYYADAYHPGWRAYVDGRSVPIAQANLAFKAIKLEEGKHVVRFQFFGGLSGIASILIALTGFCFTAFILFAVFATLFRLKGLDYFRAPENP